MGGRGKSQPTDTGFTWYDYHAVYKHDNIHFLAMNDEHASVSPPVMSQTPNVAYVTFDKDKKKLKHISLYVNRKKIYDIDLIQPHNKELGAPHVHECDPKTGYRLGTKTSVHKPSAKQFDLINRVYEIFNNYKKEIQGK